MKVNINVSLELEANTLEEGQVKIVGVLLPWLQRNGNSYAVSASLAEFDIDQIKQAVYDVLSAQVLEAYELKIRRDAENELIQTITEQRNEVVQNLALKVDLA